METATQIVDKILKAKKLEDVVPLTNWKEAYRRQMLQIHPDVCSLPEAAKAAARLNELRENFEQGKQYDDESGTFCTNGYITSFKGERSLLKRSFENYNRLRSVGSPHFLRYLPLQMHWEGDKLISDHAHRALPLAGQTLPQEHVNWVLSRLLELTIQLNEAGYVHGGLTPESVFIVPETHGIQVNSFYHLKPTAGRVTTINARYKHWYPSSLFTEKRASPLTDIELSKKIAICLLGDTSGSGIKLKKTHHPSIIDFLIAQSTDPLETYREYRSILKKHFKNRFHILNI